MSAVQDSVFLCPTNVQTIPERTRSISDLLAHDVLRLMLELGYKPRYGRRRGIWQLFLSSISDGFKSSRNVSNTAVSKPMYRLAIEDFSVTMAGRNGKFQWTGVSAVN